MEGNHRAERGTMEDVGKIEASTSIYVVDREYRIVYFNERLARIVPGIKTGDICYQRLCKEERPCRDCPILRKHGDDSMFYNRLLGKWIEATHEVIEWPGAGTCTLLLAKALDEGNKNLFYNLTRISMYDELYELNLSENTYKILMHQDGKYVSPEPEGVLDEMILEVADDVIHPEDREHFLDFWDINRVRNYFGGENDTLMKGEFRKKLQNGGYCWTAQIAVPLRYVNSDEEILICFIQDIQEQKEREGCHVPQIDELTGLYLKNIFFEKVWQFLADKNPQEYCMMAIDIEHFKLYNDWYGREAGDLFLKKIGACLKGLQEDGSCVAGYAGDDDFIVLAPLDWELLEHVQKQLVHYTKEKGNNVGFLPAFGIYLIQGDEGRVSTMHDRAIIAMNAVKGNYVSRVSLYDSSMKKKMEDDQVLLSEIQRALAQKEFLVYYQPKCNMLTGKIIGLESLIRWKHPERGMVPPSEFIPVLEANGFITNLDLYAWELVCKHVSEWIATGRRAIPISVNVSRIDIYALDVVQVFKNLVEKYGLEPKLIEIEITESAYVENYDVISGTVNDLRQAGFTVLMDDFGSGYSSLNMLRDVNVDVLKIDMKFLDMTENSFSRGVGILEAIVKMARLMRLRLIAEGVEGKEQAEFLMNIGCMYAQGYYYYRPMPKEKLEELLSDENNVDFKGIQARQMEQIRVTDLFTENLASESIIDHILGGVALYDIYNGTMELLNANEQYLRITGDNPVDLEENKDHILNCAYPEDRQMLLDGFQKAMDNPVEGQEIVFRRYRKSGELMWMSVRAFFLREQDGHRLFYGGVSDVTEKKVQEEQLASSQISPGGMMGCYCEDGYPLYFANDQMVRMLGYGAYQEMTRCIHGKLEDAIYPEDRNRIAESLEGRLVKGTEFTTEYRMLRKDGTWLWTMNKGLVVEAEDGRLAIISACMDITGTKETQKKLQEANELLSRQNMDLNYLYNDMPGGYYSCVKNQDFDFICISNRFVEIVGYSRAEIQELFDNKFYHLIHPDDRQELLDIVFGGQEKKRMNLTYRIRSKRGYIMVLEQTKEVSRDGEDILCGTVLDMSDEQGCDA